MIDNRDKDSKANNPMRANKANGAQDGQRKALEPKPFLPKKGNYRNLLVFKKAECLYDITYYFANHYFVARKDRTVDQVIQAARSGKQNIIEGCAASATSSETEIKLLGVARASMHEVLGDYEDYLRTRGLEQWDVEDPRVKQIQEYSKTHNRPTDYTKDIDKRSPEALCNIAITLIHQYDNMMGRLLDRLQMDFVENGGIREQMTAARLGYRNVQQTRITELEAENAQLRARIAELEAQQGQTPRPPLGGGMGLRGLIGLIRLIGPISLIGLMSFIGLISCSKEQIEEPEPLVQEVISFSGGLQEENDVVAGTRTETSLAGKGITSFQVWAFKNKGIEEDNNGDPVEPTNYITPQCVIPGYTVTWANNSAYTTTTNSSGWEYVNGEEQTIKYWDYDAKAYKFFGFAPATANVTTEFYHVGEGYETYEEYGYHGADGSNYSKCRMSLQVNGNYEDDNDPLTTNPYVSRLWFSDGSEVPSQFGKPVKLEFTKPLAKVRFMFTFADGVNLTRAKIEDPVFRPTDPHAGIPLGGTIDYEFPITGTATTASWNSTVKDYSENVYFTEDWYTDHEKWYTVLPVKSQGNYTLTANINGADQTTEVPASYMSWSPGYSYTYIFKVMEGGGIKFDEVQVAIKTWDVASTATRQVYNW
ncbi:MAG: four helix bundle suffix domain-containing protein [Bacteroidaceae bacterium]|nr:four helix bundle suffix domain-containing protein [Bacteroidaceae bacterium]